jgi:hypothetical protein
MFREIRTRERMSEEDRRREEELRRMQERENLQRIAGRHYTQTEVEEANAFWNDLFSREIEV